MRLVVTVVMAVLLAACGGLAVDPTTTQDPSATPTTSAPPVAAATPTSVPLEATTTTATPVSVTLAEADLAAYIAVVEHLLEGTTYEGKALESPHVFLATGALFCDELRAGTAAEQILSDYIEALTGGSVDDASGDDLTMAGAVLGSGLAELCPSQIGVIGVSD